MNNSTDKASKDDRELKKEERNWKNGVVCENIMEKSYYCYYQFFSFLLLEGTTDQHNKAIVTLIFLLVCSNDTFEKLLTISSFCLHTATKIFPRTFLNQSIIQYYKKKFNLPPQEMMKKQQNSASWIEILWRNNRGERMFT